MFNLTNVPEISPTELIDHAESGEPIQVLDIRAPERAALGKIEVVTDDHYVNMRGSEVAANGDLIGAGLATDRPLAVVCDMGQSSKQIVALLNSKGWDARSVTGGMAQWGNVLAKRPLKSVSTIDQMFQFDRVAKGSLGYLLVSDGEAIILDAPRNYRPYLDAAKSVGATVVAVAESHLHADYISGGPDIANELGVPYYVHENDPYSSDFSNTDCRTVKEGSAINLGRASLNVVHTPGHTPGSVTYILENEVAFTGDFIFVNSMGRPDLGGKEESWTGELWRSVERARREWMGDTRIFPAHYSSNTERQQDNSVGGVLQELLKTNKPLAMKSEAEFTEWVNAHKTSFPEAYMKIRAINVGTMQVSADEAQVLDVGKNQCAVG